MENSHSSSPAESSAAQALSVVQGNVEFFQALCEAVKSADYSAQSDIGRKLQQRIPRLSPDEQLAVLLIFARHYYTKFGSMNAPVCDCVKPLVECMQPEQYRQAIERLVKVYNSEPQHRRAVLECLTALSKLPLAEPDRQRLIENLMPICQTKVDHRVDVGILQPALALLCQMLESSNATTEQYQQAAQLLLPCTEHDNASVRIQSNVNLVTVVKRLSQQEQQQCIEQLVQRFGFDNDKDNQTKELLLKLISSQLASFAMKLLLPLCSSEEPVVRLAAINLLAELLRKYPDSLNDYTVRLIETVLPHCTATGFEECNAALIILNRLTIPLDQLTAVLEVLVFLHDELTNLNSNLINERHRQSTAAGAQDQVVASDFFQPPSARKKFRVLVSSRGVLATSTQRQLSLDEIKSRLEAIERQKRFIAAITNRLKSVPAQQRVEVMRSVFDALPSLQPEPDKLDHQQLIAAAEARLARSDGALVSASSQALVVHQPTRMPFILSNILEGLYRDELDEAEWLQVLSLLQQHVDQHSAPVARTLMQLPLPQIPTLAMVKAILEQRATVAPIHTDYHYALMKVLTQLTFLLPHAEQQEVELIALLQQYCVSNPALQAPVIELLGLRLCAIVAKSEREQARQQVTAAGLTLALAAETTLDELASGEPVPVDPKVDALCAEANSDALVSQISSIKINNISQQVRVFMLLLQLVESKYLDHAARKALQNQYLHYTKLPEVIYRSSLATFFLRLDGVSDLDIYGLIDLLFDKYRDRNKVIDHLLALVDSSNNKLVAAAAHYCFYFAEKLHMPAQARHLLGYLTSDQNKPTVTMVVWLMLKIFYQSNRSLQAAIDAAIQPSTIAGAGNKQIARQEQSPALIQTAINAVRQVLGDPPASNASALAVYSVFCAAAQQPDEAVPGKQQAEGQQAEGPSLPGLGADGDLD